MSILTDTWRQLVRRRLLPVAGLLLAALAAVPFALAKDPAPAPPATAPAVPAAGKTEPLGTPIVALATDNGEARRRRVLGARKDPFRPAPAPKVKAAPTATASTPRQDTSPTGTSGGGSTGGGSAPSSPSTAATPSQPKKYELYSLTVRFGDASSDTLPRMNLKRLQPLPDEEEPVLVYLGVGGDKKSAVFMVDSTVVAQGDGQCKPHPANCETITLREGDTEFFDVTDEQGVVTAQYELDLIRINRKSTASASKAKAARAAKSSAGNRILKAIAEATGPLGYRYDATTGTVRTVDEATVEAAAAATAVNAARVAQLFGAGA
jgi:hypothetical protein